MLRMVIECDSPGCVSSASTTKFRHGEGYEKVEALKSDLIRRGWIVDEYPGRNLCATHAANGYADGGGGKEVP